MKCPKCKQLLIEDYCDHLMLNYDESFQEFVYVNDDFSLDEFSSKYLDGVYISSCTAYKKANRINSTFGFYRNKIQH